MLGRIGKDARHVMKANGLEVPSSFILSKKICGIWRRLSLFLKARSNRNQRNTKLLEERSIEPSLSNKIIQTKIIQSFIVM